MKKRLTILVAVLLLFSFALFACSSNDPGEGSGEALSPKHGGTLRIAIDTTTALDPTFLTTSGDNQAAAMWNDYLVFCDEDGRPDPERSLAESWDYDEGEKAWTFKLRDNVLFHDGKEMTSRDVKYTFDRLRDPDVGAKTVDLFSNIVDITTPDAGRAVMVSFGIIWGYLFGWLMNLFLVVVFIKPLTWKAVFLAYVASFPMDTFHALGNACFYLLLGPQVIKVLKRFQEKMTYVEI